MGLVVRTGIRAVSLRKVATRAKLGPAPWVTGTGTAWPGCGPGDTGALLGERGEQGARVGFRRQPGVVRGVKTSAPPAHDRWQGLPRREWAASHGIERDARAE
jgi:hypothetical protein